MAAKSWHPAKRLDHVGRVYGVGARPRVAALKEVDLEHGQVSFVGGLGLSCSGKTTLLNLIGGIEEPTSGRILVAGNEITNIREYPAFGLPARPGRVRAFQFFNLYAFADRA